MNRINRAALNGWPLYWFAKDQAPGDIKGQGVGDTWFAATPEGEKANGRTGTGTAGTNSGGNADGGYDVPPPGY